MRIVKIRMSILSDLSELPCRYFPVYQVFIFVLAITVFVPQKGIEPLTDVCRFLGNVPFLWSLCLGQSYNSYIREPTANRPFSVYRRRHANYLMVRLDRSRLFYFPHRPSLDFTPHFRSTLQQIFVQYYIGFGLLACCGVVHNIIYDEYSIPFVY